MSGTGRMLGRRELRRWLMISGLSRFGLSPPRGMSRWLPVTDTSSVTLPGDASFRHWRESLMPLSTNVAAPWKENERFTSTSGDAWMKNKEQWLNFNLPLPAFPQLRRTFPRLAFANCIIIIQNLFPKIYFKFRVLRPRLKFANFAKHAFKFVINRKLALPKKRALILYH